MFILIRNIIGKSNRSRPMMGSGTTGIAASKPNRKFMSIEKDVQTFEMARAQIKKYRYY